MRKMRAVQVPAPKGAFEIVEREAPEPGPGAVLLRVRACGICHSDVLTKEGHWPGIRYPRIPGHEVAGVVEAVGPDVVRWKKGDRAGVGWNGGYCGACDPCRRGLFFACAAETRVTGITHDGGYADYVTAAASALARIPDGLTDVEAAPLLCAGLTTFNALRNCGARPGDLVAVHGVGGLGHLGVQFASRMGFRTVAVARGAEKSPLARELGAWRYLDAKAQDPAAELQKLGGAKAILATVTDGPAMTAIASGLGLDGKLMVLGAPESLSVSPILLISGRRSIAGWYSGTSIDAEETLAFAAQTGVRSRSEIFPLERAAAAYERMMGGQAKFKVVLTAE